MASSLRTRWEVALVTVVAKVSSSRSAAIMTTMKAIRRTFTRAISLMADTVPLLAPTTIQSPWTIVASPSHLSTLAGLRPAEASSNSKVDTHKAVELHRTAQTCH